MEAQALLATKEKDPIPEDLTVVEALVKEHLVSRGFYSINVSLNINKY
jgi:hypothetical protein